MKRIFAILIFVFLCHPLIAAADEGEIGFGLGAYGALTVMDIPIIHKAPNLGKGGQVDANSKISGTGGIHISLHSPDQKHWGDMGLEMIVHRFGLTYPSYSMEAYVPSLRVPITYDFAFLRSSDRTPYLMLGLGPYMDAPLARLKEVSTKSNPNSTISDLSFGGVVEIRGFPLVFKSGSGSFVLFGITLKVHYGITNDFISDQKGLKASLMDGCIGVEMTYLP